MVNIVESFNSWLENSSTRKSTLEITDLFLELGMNDCVILILTNNKIHIEEIGSDFSTHNSEILHDNSVKSDLLDIIKKEIAEFTFIIDKKNYSGFNLSPITRDNRKEVILLHNRDPSITIQRMGEIISLAYRLKGMTQRIFHLESSVKLGQYSPFEEISFYKEISRSDVPISFYVDALPSIFYCVVNERIGPLVITGVPGFITGIDYQFLAVNIFTGVDSTMVSELGHIFTSTQINQPELGELYSLIFTVANDKARGKFEIHSLSLLVSHEFSNLAKSIIHRLKPSLFTGIERIRQLLNKNEDSSLAIDIENISEATLQSILQISNDTRDDFGFDLARLLKKEDLINWRK